MITIKTFYDGDLRTSSFHVLSNSKIITDAPADNNGKGESFSPTDLLATALGTCMLTIIGISANKNGYSIDGTEVSIIKIMESNPRRVAKLIVDFQMPLNNYTESQKKMIYSAAVNCPVAKSISSELVQKVNFNW